MKMNFYPPEDVEFLNTANNYYLLRDCLHGATAILMSIELVLVPAKKDIYICRRTHTHSIITWSYNCPARVEFHRAAKQNNFAEQV